MRAAFSILSKIVMHQMLEVFNVGVFSSRLSIHHNRLVDLAESCDDEDLSSLDGCNCRTARRLLRNGEIDCSDSCPTGCEVCDICLGIACGQAAFSIARDGSP